MSNNDTGNDESVGAGQDQSPTGSSSGETQGTGARSEPSKEYCVSCARGFQWECGHEEKLHSNFDAAWSSDSSADQEDEGSDSYRSGIHRGGSTREDAREGVYTGDRTDSGIPLHHQHEGSEAEAEEDEEGYENESDLIARSQSGKRTRRFKNDAALRDQQSTGRKRASRLYPLDPDADCEWAGITNAGGGQYPIEGCGGNSKRPVAKQECRHHGPDKNTLNNEPGNVHRICVTCHNRWHALNDKGYVWGSKTRGD